MPFSCLSEKLIYLCNSIINKTMVKLLKFHFPSLVGNMTPEKIGEIEDLFTTTFYNKENSYDDEFYDFCEARRETILDILKKS